MIKKYLFLSFFLLFNSFIQSNINDYFKYDPFLRFPTSWLIGSFGGLLIKYRLKKFPLNLYSLKKSLFSKEILLGGLLGIIFYETFFMPRLLPQKIEVIEEIDNEKNEDILRINIFIHGSLIAPEGTTRPSGPRPSFTGFIRSIIQQFNRISSVENMYKNKNEFANKKNRSFLFKNDRFPFLAGIHPSLEKITENTVTKSAFNNIYTPFIKDSKDSKKEISFSFNWDGDLSEISRKVAGKKLNEELLRLKEIYPNAKIHAFCHSHGGNVLLHALQSTIENYKIDEIYFFGTPIRKKTNNLLETLDKAKFDSLFNIFSLDDYVQTSDFIFALPSRPVRTIDTNQKNIFNIRLVLDPESKIIHEDFFVYDPKKSHNSALVKYFHDFSSKFKKEKKILNINNFLCTLNITDGKFTFS